MSSYLLFKSIKYSFKTRLTAQLVKSLALCTQIKARKFIFKIDQKPY